MSGSKRKHGKGKKNGKAPKEPLKIQNFLGKRFPDFPTPVK
jgi:hypothetical protein